MKTKGKILVIRGGAIGDFILTLPVFAALREAFDETELHLLGYPRTNSLMLDNGLVDGTHSIDSRGMAGFFARKGSLDEQMEAYFEDFSIIVSYLYDPDQVFRDNIARASKAQFIQGPHRPDESIPLHATEVFLKPLERLAIFGANPQPILPIIAPPLPVVSRMIALHPGSGSESKNWPLSQWREFTQRLVTETTDNFLLVGGNADVDRVDALLPLFPPGRLSVARDLSLSELASTLKTCGAFVGHDSGITHLAAAVGLAGVVLWGPSRAEIWRPRSDEVRLVTAPGGICGIQVDQVLDQVLALRTRDKNQRA